MRTLFSILFFFTALSNGFGQNFEEALQTGKIEEFTGKVYGKCCIVKREIDTWIEDSSILIEITEPQFIRIEKILNQTNPTLDSITVKIKDSTFLITNAANLMKKNCPSAFSADCVLFHIHKIPAQYKTFYSEEINKDDFTYSYDSLISSSKLREHTIHKKPVVLDSTQLFLRRGGHTDFREVTCPIECPSYMVKNVQKALNRLGYTIPKDNKLGTETRNALIDYQKSNGLPVGNLNVETMKHLGIEEY